MILSGLGQSYDELGQPIEAVSIGDTATNIVTGVNAEALWLTNLAREARGLAPLAPSASAPKVNIGLSPEVQMLIIGGIAAVVLIALIYARK